MKKKALTPRFAGGGDNFKLNSHFLVILLIALMLSSCTTHLTDLSMISNKNITLKEIDIDRTPQRKYVVGKDSKFNLLFIPFGYPKIKEAVNDALQKGEGDLIVDASIYYSWWWFVVGQSTIQVKGTVVNTRGGK